MSRLDQRAIDALRAYEKAEKATGFDPAPGPSRSRGSRRPRTTIPSPRAKCSQLSAVLTGTKFAQLSWSVVTAGMNPSTPTIRNTAPMSRTAAWTGVANREPRWAGCAASPKPSVSLKSCTHQRATERNTREPDPEPESMTDRGPYSGRGSGNSGVGASTNELGQVSASMRAVTRTSESGSRSAGTQVHPGRRRDHRPAGKHRPRHPALPRRQLSGIDDLPGARADLEDERLPLPATPRPSRRPAPSRTECSSSGADDHLQSAGGQACGFDLQTVYNDVGGRLEGFVHTADLGPYADRIGVAASANLSLRACVLARTSGRTFLEFVDVSQPAHPDAGSPELFPFWNRAREELCPLYRHGW
ncbi:conserved hypothetical protein (plasmid) [Rhodococcus jostii RHA1]|uniref:Uncharacterized protein n=1 Tax=Rhodococcus jostii (strain RHA1) TaxID=101510 RepID=Q0RZW4_RHOJR|nr:conserved hypothetical protein [Rhodococcus jostii RHA1]